jgi:hypothetical protein
MLTRAMGKAVGTRRLGPDGSRRAAGRVPGPGARGTTGVGHMGNWGGAASVGPLSSLGRPARPGPARPGVTAVSHVGPVPHSGPAPHVPDTPAPAPPAPSPVHLARVLRFLRAPHMPRAFLRVCSPRRPAPRPPPPPARCRPPAFAPPSRPLPRTRRLPARRLASHYVVQPARGPRHPCRTRPAWTRMARRGRRGAWRPRPQPPSPPAPPRNRALLRLPARCRRPRRIGMSQRLRLQLLPPRPRRRPLPAISGPLCGGGQGGPAGWEGAGPGGAGGSAAPWRRTGSARA